MNRVENIVGNCMVDVWFLDLHCRRRTATAKRFIT